MNTETILGVFMKDEITQQRILAVQRFLSGEKPESICASLGRSKSWLYKWVERRLNEDVTWNESRSKQPLNVTNRTPKEIEEIDKIVRLNLYNQDLFCGAQAILWELEDLGIKPVPSLRTINDAYGVTSPKFKFEFWRRDPSGVQLGLILNEAKTKIVNSHQERFSFLGFSIRMGQSRKSGNIYTHVEPSKKSRQIIKDRVTIVTKRARMVKPLENIVHEVNATVRV
jgi:hypothetical protein